MVVIGLTGSIGMGKTLVATQFASLGAKICNADTIVHGLLANDKSTIAKIAKHFPKAVSKGAVDRKILGEIIFSDAKKRHELERILHPRVIAKENAFIQREQRKGTRAVVLEIPLLFETGGEKRCHVVVTTSAPKFLQRQRVLRRAHMTEEKFNAILKIQMSDQEKRKRADILIQTGLGRAYSFRSVLILMRLLRAA